MMIAIPDDEWKVFRQYTQSEFTEFLLRLSANVKLSVFRKHPRGPKKKPKKRKSDPETPHFSTAKLIAMRKKQENDLQRDGVWLYGTGAK